ncbi:hypothetical protein NQ314_021138 [Rhamnusium bicolor]|uniref:DDE Tnp4 domain-containing protein n=1 Tax=Rhamnusium bicolor TaxID=1586634 RepID=A0AAV8WJE1_9CUCU|nr:hypothetical protein NQ314_021138 [Rhamnusium bicolor]
MDVIAGPRMEIMDIVVRHPGSTHDSVIFDRSSARVRFEQGHIVGLLLGDNGYPCRPYLLTPLINPANQREENYNRAHKSTRNIVERVFGMWKWKFPCLSRMLRTKIQTTMAMVCACAVLHNISIQQNEEPELAEPAVEEIPINNMIVNNVIGLEFRRQFIIQHF